MGVGEADTLGRVALVTGGAGGVGEGIVLCLADSGWDIAINYRTSEENALRLQEKVIAAGRRCLLVPADVGDEEDVRRMFDLVLREMGALHLLVNNAGRQTWAPLVELAPSEWDQTIRANLRGTFLCTQAAARIMSTGGSIVNIGSGANRVPFPRLADYCASKGGIEAFTRVAAVELAALGLRVNCVAPGAIEIPRTRRENAEYAATWSRITPAKRVGTPEDVGNAVVFLAGEKATFITGQTLFVDGGLWCQGPWPYSVEDGGS